MMLGERVFAYIGKPVPDWYLGMKQKSWMYMMGAFFFTNMVYTSLVSTGAFEIYVDGWEIFSKLKSGWMIENKDVEKVLWECGIDL